MHKDYETFLVERFVLRIGRQRSTISIRRVSLQYYPPHHCRYSRTDLDQSFSET